MKASLVAAFFMHLRHDKLFNTLAFLAAFLFLGDLHPAHVRRPRRPRAASTSATAARSILADGRWPRRAARPATSATPDDVGDEAPGGHQGAAQQEGVASSRRARRRTPRALRRSPRSAAHRGAGSSALAAWRRSSAGCKRKHVPVDAVPELGYPTCGDAGTDERGGDRGGAGTCAPGRSRTEKNVVERFELRRTSCGYTFHSRQEWPLAISDVEVRYDADLTPDLGVEADDDRAARSAPTATPTSAATSCARGRCSSSGATRRARSTLREAPAGRAHDARPRGRASGAVIGPGRGDHHGVAQAGEAPGRAARRSELVLDFRDMVESPRGGRRSSAARTSSSRPWARRCASTRSSAGRRSSPTRTTSSSGIWRACARATR